MQNFLSTRWKTWVGLTGCKPSRKLIVLDYVPQKCYAQNCRIREAKYGNFLCREESDRNTKLHVIPMKEMSNGSRTKEGISKRRNERIRYNNWSREGKAETFGKKREEFQSFNSDCSYLYCLSILHYKRIFIAVGFVAELDSLWSKKVTLRIAKIIIGNTEIEPHRIRDFYILMQVSILLLVVDTLRAIIINKLFVKLYFLFLSKSFLHDA